MTRCLLVNYSNDICSVWIDSRNYVNLDRYPYKYLGQVWWFAFGIERYQISNIELGIGRGWSLGKHLPCLFQLCYQRFVAIRCNLKIRKYFTYSTFSVVDEDFYLSLIDHILYLDIIRQLKTHYAIVIYPCFRYFWLNTLWWWNS